MAKYSVTYSCGHDGCVSLFGSNSQRERRLNYLHNYGVCPACAEAARQKENAERKQQNAVAGMPPLTGTEKQIAWAESIRNKYYNAWIELKNTYKPEDRPTMDSYICQGLRRDKHTKAAWWIDRRSHDNVDLLKELLAFMAPQQ